MRIRKLREKNKNFGILNAVEKETFVLLFKASNFIHLNCNVSWDQTKCYLFIITCINIACIYNIFPL